MATYDPYDDLIRDIEKRESGGRDYDASGRLLTSPKGAQGRMQVMPFTSSDPGFGVTPAKDNSKEELARVGRDYARAMLDRYGDKKLAMMAYNWGPGSVDKWLAAGADPKAVPRETRRYVQDVQDNQGGFMKVGQRGGSSEAKLQQYTVELPSGKRYTVEGYSPDDAYRLAEEFDIQNKPAKGGALSDIVKSLKSGAYGLAQLPSNIYGIATGDYDQLGGEFLRGKQKEIQESMSPEYLAQQQAAQQAISEAEKEGELAGGLEALKQYVTSPRLLANLAAESAPSMIGSLGVGKLAQMGVAGIAKKGLQAAASEEAAKAAAARAATIGSRTAKGTMATMQGGDVAQQTYQAVYDEAIKQGYTDAHARDVAGIEARKAGLMGGAISLATMSVPGNILPSVETGFFKGVGGKSFAGGLARGFAGEATQEALEEGGGRIAQNLGVQAVNPEQSAMQGVGSTMAQAGLAGGLFGGPIGGLHTRAEVQQKAQEEAAAAQRKRFEEQAAIRAEQQRVEAERNAGIEAHTAAQNEDLLAGREAAVSSTADEFISKLDTVDGINELLQNPRQWLRDDVSKEDVNKFRNDLKQMREALKEKQKREAELSSQSAFNQPVETTTPPPATDTALAQGASEAVASKLDEFNEKAKTVEGVNDLLKNLKSWFPTANRDELTGFKSTLEKMRSDLQATQAADAKKAKQSAFAAAEVDAQGNVIVPPETQITPEKLKSWGVNRGSNLYKALLGKDIANPEDFAFTRTALEAAASTTKAEGFATKLENVLNTELAPKEEKSPVQEQAGVQTEEQAAPVQSTEVVDEAALEEQRAQEEHNKLRFLDMQNRLRTPAEREQMAAEERARREEGFAAAEEEKRRQEEAMFAQQEQENADYAEKGTQFPLHSFGAQPQTQENVAPELDQLLTEYLDARERVNSDPNAEYEMQDIEALARETYGGRRWASAKYEAVKRRQGQLDFEGKQRAEEEPRGEAAVRGQERGVGRKSGEPSVGLATQPQEQPAAEVAQAPATRGVGPTERVPAQRDEGKKREQRALEVDPVQLVSDLQEISDREKNNDIGKRARTYLREAQQGNAKDMAPAAAFAEEHKAPAKEAPKVEKTADELEADLADALAEGNEKRAAAIEAKLSKIGKKPIAKEEVEAAAEVADETRTRKYSGDKEAFEGSTVDRLMAAVKQLFNNPTQLNRKLSIVQSVNDLPADIRADFEASEKKGVIQRAVYDGETDRVYLVADRVPANMALGIILHENGVHQGMRTLLGPQLHSQLISQINQWAKTGTGIEGEIARRAQARVEAAGKANVQENDEILAYFTEIANQEYGIDPTAIKGSTPLANWFRRLWAAVKTAVRKLGINPEKMTAQDVIDLAYGAARLEFNGAWHGTAADFRRFSHEYMGTGEGAQAFGWGTYLAQRPGIAKGYFEADMARKGGVTREIMFDGAPLNQANTDLEKDGLGGMEAMLHFGSKYNKGRSIDDVAKQVIGSYEDDINEYRSLAENETSPAMRRRYAKLADMAQAELDWVRANKSRFSFGKTGSEGNLMRVDANVRDDEMLDWNAPFSAQSQLVKDALRGNIGMDGNPDITYEGSKGSMIYDQLESALGSDKAASEYLDSIGIKGVKFLDAQSRNSTGNTKLFIDGKETTPTMSMTEGERYGLIRLTRNAGNLESTIREAEEGDDLFGAKDEELAYLNSLRGKNIRAEAKDQTRNLVIFNDKNLHRTFSQPGARRHERKFSGYAPADAIMERAGGRMPTEEDTSLSATLNNIKSNYTSVGDLSTKLYDKVMGALSKEYAFEEGHRRRIEAVFGKNAEAAKEFAKLGLIAQAGHIPAVADVAMEKGGITYDPTTFMFKATESDANFANIQNQLVDLAKKYGVSYDTMRAYNNTAMQSRRMDGLYKTRDEMLRQAAYLEQSNKPAERKKAKELRDKYEDMPFHRTREEVQEGLKLFDAIPELADIERQKNDIRSWVARFMVDSGFWTQEHANDMLDIADWVPFNREFDESEQYDLNKFKQYAHGLQANFKEYGFKGSNREVADVLDNFERWVHSALTRSMRNKATAELLKDAVKYGGADYVQSSSKTQTSSTAHFYEDGKIKYVRFDNPLEAAFFTSGVATPPVSKLNQFFNKIFRESIIAAPTFSIAQLVKDPVDAMVRSGLPPQHAIKIQGYALAEMASLLKGEKTEAFKALQERGLAGAAADLATLRRDELKNLIGYKAVQNHKDGKLLNVLTRLRDKGLKMSMFADNAVRQAVYRAALEAGETETTALKLAADTINFRRQLGSDSLASLASHIPFFGASLAAVRASLTVLGGRGSSTTKAEARKRLVQNLAMLATIKVLFSMASGDDDEYKRMSPLQRARQLTLPGMGGFGIPMRVSLESLPAILAELTYNQLTDNASDPAAARKAVAGLIIDAVNPVSAPLSAPVKTAIEQVTDYNFFTGSPIVGERLKKQEAYLQYGEGTSEFAKLMGSVANQLGFSNAISPKRVDHLIHGLLGVTGSSALLASNIVAGEMGVREPMSAKEIAASIPGLTMPGAKEFNNEERNLFYDWANKVQTVTETLRHLKQEGRAEEYVAYVEEHRDLLKYQKMVEQVEKQLSKIRNTISVVRASNAPAEEKEQRIRELKEIEQRYIKNLDIKKLRSETM